MLCRIFAGRPGPELQRQAEGGRCRWNVPCESITEDREGSVRAIPLRLALPALQSEGDLEPVQLREVGVVGQRFGQRRLRRRPAIVEQGSLDVPQPERRVARVGGHQLPAHPRPGAEGVKALEGPPRLRQEERRVRPGVGPLGERLQHGQRARGFLLERPDVPRGD
ncbi:MAG: hypothetical protein KC549_10115, partial [Myxococcales bacterium]|nr:hypothetical protein [Myxococcales bacterium]